MHIAQCSWSPRPFPHIKKQATLAAANTDVTITINAHGEVNVDQAAIASVLGSGQQSAKVTFVRIGEEGATVENQVCT